MLALLGFLRDSPAEDEVERRRVTYARWEKKGDANPVRFAALSEDLLRTLRDSGSLFARKFGASCVSLPTLPRSALSLVRVALSRGRE